MSTLRSFRFLENFPDPVPGDDANLARSWPPLLGRKTMLNAMGLGLDFFRRSAEVRAILQDDVCDGHLSASLHPATLWAHIYFGAPLLALVVLREALVEP